MNTTSPHSRFAKFMSQFHFEVPTPRQDSKNGTVKVNRVRWTGKVGYVELGSVCGCVARIELDEQGYQGNYSALRVDIIHRDRGKLDSLVFSFNELLDPKARSDERTKDHTGFHGWAASGGPIGWYIAVPRDVYAVDAAVNEYLEMWQAR